MAAGSSNWSHHHPYAFRRSVIEDLPRLVPTADICRAHQSLINLASLSALLVTAPTFIGMLYNFRRRTHFGSQTLKEPIKCQHETGRFFLLSQPRCLPRAQQVRSSPRDWHRRPCRLPGVVLVPLGCLRYHHSNRLRYHRRALMPPLVPAPHQPRLVSRAAVARRWAATTRLPERIKRTARPRQGVKEPKLANRD